MTAILEAVLNFSTKNLMYRNHLISHLPVMILFSICRLILSSDSTAVFLNNEIASARK